jgi:sigma-E factor negative regulatory protein RseB
LLVVTHASLTQANDMARAKDLINKMTSATDNLNYVGTFVYQRGDQLDTMRVIHRADRSGIHERLIALTGYPREVIRDNEDVTCIFPDSKAIIIEKRGTRKFLPTNLPYPIEGIAAHYDFQLQGMDRVAGREAWVVKIEPRDSDRFGYRLWIDRESHLLLKSNMTSGDGQALQQLLFTELTLPNHIPDSALTPQVSVQGFSIVHDEPVVVESDKEKPDLEVNWLPEGFTMRDREIHPIASSRMPVDQRVYSDGLAMVSVFIEELADTTEPLEGLSQVGAVTAYGQVSDHYQVTVVGEIPNHTVRRIANSIVIKPKG